MRLNTVALGVCKGVTKLGKPCQGKDVYQNGYCTHHGGSGQLVRLVRLAERQKEKISRALKKSRAFDRKMKALLKQRPDIAAMIERRGSER